MKRLVLIVVGSVFAFCNSVMISQQPSVKTAPAQKPDAIRKLPKVHTGRTIEVTVKTGSKSVHETVLCGRPADGKASEECKKQSDLSALTQEDINAMSLHRYFSATPNSRHSYTNQSGPQTFHCDDSCSPVCKQVKKTISTKCGIENGLPTYCREEVIEEQCTEKCTHSCECIAGCY